MKKAIFLFVGLFFGFSVLAQQAPDGMPALPFPVKQLPVAGQGADGPNFPVIKYIPKKMLPDYPSYPPVAYPNKNQMLPD